MAHKNNTPSIRGITTFPFKAIGLVRKIKGVYHLVERFKD